MGTVKGSKLSEEHKKNISEGGKGKHYHTGMYGKKHTEEARRKISLCNTGKKFSEERKRNISKALKGRICLPHMGFQKRNKLAIGNQWNKGRTPWNKGIPLTPEVKSKLSKSMKGRKSPNYIDGRSKLLGPARYGDDWDRIRYVVYCRDKFACQDCGVNGIRLDIHHKIPYLFSGDNSIENLTTLCRSCHAKVEHKIRKELKQNRISVTERWLQ